MQQRINIDTLDELQAVSLETVIDGMMSGTAFGKNIRYVIQMSSAFGFDDAERPEDQRQLPLGAKGANATDYKGMEKVLQQYALTALLDNAGLSKIVKEVTLSAALWSRTQRLHQIQADQYADILSGNVLKLPHPVSNRRAEEIVRDLCDEMAKRAAVVRSLPDWNHTPQRAQWNKEADNFFQFMMNFPPVVCIYAARKSVIELKLPFDTNQTPNFQRFAEIFRDAIMAETAQ